MSLYRDSHSRPLPEFIQSVDAFKEELETGFDESHVIGGIKSNWTMCSFCQGLPRHPISSRKCGHLFCEQCFQMYFARNARPNHDWITYKQTTCPVCKTMLALTDMEVFDLFTPWAKGIYKAIQVKCPYGCEYIGSAFDVDHHQIYKCPKRVITCPNHGCTTNAQADSMKEHFNTCPMLREYCGQCHLPILKSEMENHECLAHMANIIQSMYVTLSYFFTTTFNL